MVRLVILLSPLLPSLESGWGVADVVQLDEHRNRHESGGDRQVSAQWRGFPELGDGVTLVLGDSAPWGQHGLSSLWWHRHDDRMFIDLEKLREDSMEIELG